MRNYDAIKVLNRTISYLARDRFTIAWREVERGVGNFPTVANDSVKSQKTAESWR